MGRVLREINMWWEAFCLNAPGRAGDKLRARLFSKRTNADASHALVGAGVYVRGWENLRYDDNLNVGRGCIFETSLGAIAIGKNVSFNSGVVLSSDHGHIEIGDDVQVGMNTVLRAAGHSFDQSPDVPINQQGHTSGAIVIGNDVWIGANVTILPNAHIHDHCVIGAGAVVSGTIPQGRVAVGVPAKVIKSIGKN